MIKIKVPKEKKIPPYREGHATLRSGEVIRARHRKVLGFDEYWSPSGEITDEVTAFNHTEWIGDSEGVDPFRK